MVGTQPKVMGVGCFAAEATLSRVLRKIVAAYSLGDWRAAMANGEGGSEGYRLLRRLMSDARASAGIGNNGALDERIAGFFLGFENHQLKLAVFTRRKDLKFLKYTATLDELSGLRRHRLP
jgi:hypothetical protein